MAKGYFDFKQFRVCHGRCAQKVGTDGVLLGAWADVEGTESILDIGTGSGLIALMVAQRAPKAHVVALDIDADAIGQAQGNVAASPFRERIEVCLCDVREYCKMCGGKRFQHIVCNPPFYTDDTLPPDAQRALARNAQGLPFEELIRAVEGLLDEDGCFSVILPMAQRDDFCQKCASHLLRPIRECRVQTVERKPAKRTLMTYSRKCTEHIEQETLILQEGNERSKAYQALASDFYL